MTVTVLGETLQLDTQPELFSPSRPDRGTLAMLSLLTFSEGQSVLDLGCGYGLVGIVAARKCGAEHVWMCDIDSVAVSTAERNAMKNGVGDVHVVCSDGLEAIPVSGFDLILTNPPYQSDFHVARRFIEKGFNRLKLGGRMYMVTKRRAWYRNKFVSIFGGVRIHEIDGYYVFEAEKRQAGYASVRSERR